MDIETTGPAVDINDTGGGDPEINFQISGTTTFSIGIDNSDSDKLKIGTTAPDASTSVTIDASQNVGIGNTSPTATLDVDGSAIFNESGAAVDFKIEGDTETELFYVDGSADGIGIGTSSPSTNSLLHIDGTNASLASGPHLWVTTSADAYPLYSQHHWTHDDIAMMFDAYFDGSWRSSDAGSNFRIAKKTDLLKFDYESGIAAGSVATFDNGFCLNTSGYVGIGTTSPTATLDVDGSAIFNESGAAVDFKIEGDTETELFYVDGSADGIGIGTSSPSANSLLHIDGTNASATSGPHLWVTTSTDAYPVYSQHNWSHDDIGLMFDAYYDGNFRSSDAGSNFRINKKSDLLKFEYESGIAAGNVATFDNGFCLNTSGYVGIGTTSPTHELQVLGEACIGPNGINESVLIGEHEIKLNNQGAALFSLVNTDAAGLQLQNTGTSAALGTAAINVIMTFESGGDVGIGTTNPTATLEVDGDAIFNNSGANVDFRVEGDTDTELLFIDASTDRVGISTTGPTHALQVLGEACFGPSGSGEGVLLGDHEVKLPNNGVAHFSIVNTDAAGLQIQNTSANGALGTAASNVIMTFESGGDVGIAMTNPSVELDVTGDIEYTGTITDVSDRRLKENFSSIDSVLSKIMKIKGLSYNMINDSLKRREYGVIAQDVQAVFPEMVTTVDPENGYLGVAYIQLIPVLLEATKEQQAIIEAQKKEIETQKAELDNQKAENAVQEKKVEEVKADASTNAEEIEALKAQVQQLLQLIQQQESASVGE